MRRDVYQAIADPIRREIIDLLEAKDLNVKSITENFDVSRPAVSRHLKILEECGIISIIKDGRERLCHLDHKQLIPAFLWIDQFRKTWEQRIDSFEEYINKKQEKLNQ